MNTNLRVEKKDFCKRSHNRSSLKLHQSGMIKLELRRSFDLHMLVSYLYRLRISALICVCLLFSNFLVEFCMHATFFSTLFCPLISMDTNKAYKLLNLQLWASVIAPCNPFLLLFCLSHIRCNFALQILSFMNECLGQERSYGHGAHHLLAG
jgi:hypothetical protein